MKNYPFDFQTLDEFSNSFPYDNFDQEEKELLDQLEKLKVKYRFPAIENNVGSLLSFLINLNKAKNIFEMGSGYGHSAFWYLVAKNNSIENIYLTERRDDLQSEFENLSWPQNFKAKVDYFNGDAFEKIKEVSSIDFILIDGQKSDYKRFLELAYEKMSPDCLIIIDNSYWRGSFLDPEQRKKHQSARAIFELHEFVKTNDKFSKLFIPVKDGVSVLRKV